MSLSWGEGGRKEGRGANKGGSEGRRGEQRVGKRRGGEERRRGDEETREDRRVREKGRG